LDRRKYPVGREIAKAERESINIIRQTFHGEWNYIIQPRQSPKL